MFIEVNVCEYYDEDDVNCGNTNHIWRYDRVTVCEYYYAKCPRSRINFWTNERQRTEFFKSVLWARHGNARQVPATLLLFLKLDFKPLLMYLSGACPSDSFDEALADMIHDSVDDLGKDLSRGHYEKDETKKVRFYSLTSIPGAGCSTRKRYFLGGFRHQEPITRSEQLPYACVTAFSRTSLFLERFWRESWTSFKFLKPVSKTYRPKKDIFCLLVTFSFPFWYFILWMRS